ncbi:hypothetical protein EJB05_00619, partial [Eragrostis curvula]
MPPPAWSRFPPLPSLSSGVGHRVQRHSSVADQASRSLPRARSLSPRGADQAANGEHRGSSTAAIDQAEPWNLIGAYKASSLGLPICIKILLSCVKGSVHAVEQT